MTVADGRAQRADQPRILVVDDEPSIRAALTRLFRLEGYAVAEAGSGAAALALLEEQQYDLMLLDLNMPGMAGTELMGRARDMDANLQMIVLTGHATVDSAIAAVRVVAVDYLQKPASLHEIARTVRRALRARSEEVQRRRLLDVIGSAVDVLRSGDRPELAALEESVAADAPAPHLALERERRQLVLPGDPPRVVELTAGELAVLEVLLNKPDQVLSCRQIVRLAWEYDMEEWEAQSMVRPHVFRLRQKMETDPAKPRWLKTVRGRGYVFDTHD